MTTCTRRLFDLPDSRLVCTDTTGQDHEHAYVASAGAMDAETPEGQDDD